MYFVYIITSLFHKNNVLVNIVNKYLRQNLKKLKNQKICSRQTPPISNIITTLNYGYFLVPEIFFNVRKMYHGTRVYDGE